MWVFCFLCNLFVEIKFKMMFLHVGNIEDSMLYNLKFKQTWKIGGGTEIFCN